ncbi:hypothetical protein [Photorhabdus sp. RM157S]|uniref:hypothetical protein n=1 Tax=Photorhabdus sp. RM157S TaxID=3342827 RepID=UPI000A6A1023
MSKIDIHNDKFVDMVLITELTGLSDKWFYKMVQYRQFLSLVPLLIFIIASFLI